MRMRLALLSALLAGATPLWAHGEDLALYCSAIVHGIPALVLLLAPWHPRLRVRALVAAIPIAGAYALWRFVVPALGPHDLPVLLEWALLLGPTLTALVAAFVLRSLREPSPSSR